MADEPKFEPKDPVLRDAYRYFLNGGVPRPDNPLPLRLYDQQGRLTLPAHWTEEQKRPYLQQEQREAIERITAQWKRINGGQQMPSVRFNEIFPSSTADDTQRISPTPLYQGPVQVGGVARRDYRNPMVGQGAEFEVFLDQPQARATVSKGELIINSTTPFATTEYRDKLLTDRWNTIRLTGHKDGIHLTIDDWPAGEGPLSVSWGYALGPAKEGSDVVKHSGQAHYIHLKPSAKNVYIIAGDYDAGTVAIPVTKDTQPPKIRRLSDTMYTFPELMLQMGHNPAGQCNIVLYDPERPERRQVIPTRGGKPVSMPDIRIAELTRDPKTDAWTKQSLDQHNKSIDAYERAVHATMNDAIEEFKYQGQVRDFMEGKTKTFPTPPKHFTPAQKSEPLLTELRPNAPALASSALPAKSKSIAL